MLVKHYMKKSMEIVSNPEYMAVIDTSKETAVNNGRSNSFIFDEEIRNKLYEGTANPNVDFKTDRSTTIVTPAKKSGGAEPNTKQLKGKGLSVYSSKKDFRQKENETINKAISESLDSLQKNIQKIEGQMIKQLDEQHENFLRLKKFKKTKQRTINNLSIIQPTTRRSSAFGSSLTNPKRRGSKYDIVVDALAGTFKSEKEILFDILEHSEKQMKINQEFMQKEIDVFVNKSVKEMNDAIDELRMSYLEDIKEVDESVFPDLVNELKNDMETEIDILRDRYEELRMSETDKIRIKFKSTI